MFSPLCAAAAAAAFRLTPPLLPPMLMPRHAPFRCCLRLDDVAYCGMPCLLMIIFRAFMASRHAADAATPLMLYFADYDAAASLCR